MKCTKIVFMVCCFSLAMGITVFKRRAKPQEPCKAINRVAWKVEDLVSYLSWSSRKGCGLKLSDYSVEMCTLNDCKKNSRNWVERSCKLVNASAKEKQRKKVHCSSDIPPNTAGPYLRICFTKANETKEKICGRKNFRPGLVASRSVFTKPILFISQPQARSFTVTIKEPSSGKFLNSFDKILYTIKVAEILGSGKECEQQNLSKLKNNVIVQQKSCPQNESMCIWKAVVPPGRKYCVFGMYDTDPIDNNNGPSEIAFQTVRTPTDEPVPTIVAISVSGFIVLGILSSLILVSLHRLVKSARRINEVFLEEMEKEDLPKRIAPDHPKWWMSTEGQISCSSASHETFLEIKDYDPNGVPTDQSRLPMERESSHGDPSLPNDDDFGSYFSRTSNESSSGSSTATDYTSTSPPCYVFQRSKSSMIPSRPDASCRTVSSFRQESSTSYDRPQSQLSSIEEDERTLFISNNENSDHTSLLKEGRDVDDLIDEQDDSFEKQPLGVGNEAFDKDNENAENDTRDNMLMESRSSHERKHVVPFTNVSKSNGYMAHQ